MKKWIVRILLLGVLVLGGVWLIVVKNQLKRLDEDINTQWTRVEEAHQKRTDLIPTLVTTARDYAEFDEETLNDVLSAHTGALVTPMSGSKVTQTHLNRFQTDQNVLSHALLELLQVVDRYPYLKTYDEFKEPLTQLEEVTGDIRLEESKFNEQVGIYNIELQIFPKDIFSSILGFDERSYFVSSK